MFGENRPLLKHREGQPRIQIAWNAIQQAGNDLMTKSGAVEHGYVLAGSMLSDGQGGVIAKVDRVLSLGAGTAGAFDVGPDLARDIQQYPYGADEQFMGFAHSHRRVHDSAPSRPDLEYARRLTNQRICMVIKLNEDEHGRRDGGGTISVFNGDGYVDYAIVGNGNRQDFRAEEMGSWVDTQRLQSPVDPPKPEQIHPRGNVLV